MSGVDFGKTAGDYAQYRAGFPPSLFERLAALGVGLAGQRVLDVGTGTGSMARGFARGGADVTGLDLSAPLLAEAARLAERELPADARVRWVQGRAEETGFDDASFEVVSAGQCWHWFDSRRAAAEARRLLRPSGALVITFFDWVAFEGGVADATEELIARSNPSWPWRGFSGASMQWLDGAARAGFDDRQAFAYEVDVPYSHEAWRGRIRASAGVGASLHPDGVARFDAALRDLLATRFPQDPLAIRHRVFAMIAR